jgi:hypothetical protein
VTRNRPPVLFRGGWTRRGAGNEEMGAAAADAAADADRVSAHYGERHSIRAKGNAKKLERRG